MKEYIGVKLIQAEPELNSVEPKVREGYKVVYSDGYTSWSPKDIFEESYKEVKFPTNIKKADSLVEERLVVETLELENKVYKLQFFIDTNDVYQKLPKEEQSRLNQQLLAMKYYLTILVERLENFKNV